MGTRSTPLIAVDISLLANESGGLTRYLRELLPALVRLSVDRCRWVLYGRRGSNVAPELLSAIRLREDNLPSNLGRVASLFTSMPYWAKRDMPDVFWGPAHRLPLWLPSSTKKVVTVHDLCWLLAPETMHPMTRTLDAFFMPRALKHAHRIIAVSKATQVDLIGSFPAVTQKIKVVHEGACPLPSPLPVESLANWCISQPYVLFVGTLEPRKNLLHLLEAFAHIQKKRPTSEAKPPQLVIAGNSGWGNDNLLSSILRLGLSDCVRILGHVPDAQLSTLYRHAVCLAMPSLYEGFGLPLVEAMSQGTPVLTSLTSSMPEVAGHAGCLVEPLDIGSIEAGLMSMLFEPSYRDGLAARAKLQAANFAWDRAALETLQELLQCC